MPSESLGTANRSYLFAPGNNPKLLDRVFEAGADAVVLDLEDAVPPGEKGRARELVATVLDTRAAGGASGPAVYVRVNGLETGRTRDDLLATVRPGLWGVRLPKVESAAAVREVSVWLAQAERAAGIPEGRLCMQCTIESVSGVVGAQEIAAADPRVQALVFGHVDFCLDIGVTPSGDGSESLVARSLLVLASRAAGIAPPVDGAYARLKDPEGLRRSAEQAKALGYFGKSAIHPEQLPVIHETFTPNEREMATARAIVAAAVSAEATGSGVIQMPGGQFVDRPVALRAAQTLQLAARISEGAKGR